MKNVIVDIPTVSEELEVGDILITPAGQYIVSNFKNEYSARRLNGQNRHSFGIFDTLRELNDAWDKLGAKSKSQVIKNGTYDLVIKQTTGN